MKVDPHIALVDLEPLLESFFALARTKIARVQQTWDPAHGSPVFTQKGRYTSRGWTEWTQGFQFGMALLLFDASEEESFWALGRSNTLQYMAPHITHIGVHDHGFNNVSTYGNLRRLALEGRTPDSEDQIRYYEIALKASGAVQAARWSRIHDGTGFIHSFNGPHSLFSDTVRSCRALIVAHLLGHCLMGENDRRISLLERATQHLINTARYNVFFGEGRDAYDVRGRVAHEGLFNMTDGQYRCPSTQQGYSPFTTWTRGLAWILLGFAEEMECFRALPEEAFDGFIRQRPLMDLMKRTMEAVADYYLQQTASDGIPYWDTGAPGLAHMGDYLSRPSEPDNPHEPVDSSAAAIAAQGLLRFGHLLGEKTSAGRRYFQAGLTVAQTLLKTPYLSESPKHEGLLLHSVYHRPNGWDYVPKGKSVPFGESSMWGDYHMMELAVYLKRLLKKQPYLTFFTPRNG